MSAWVPTQPALNPVEGPELEHVVPEMAIEEVRARWTVRSAQYRAWVLARDVFGDSVSVRLQGASIAAGRSGAYPFRGLVYVDVPFHSAQRHQERERAFVKRTQSDPVLSEVSLVYVFSPRATPGPEEQR